MKTLELEIPKNKINKQEANQNGYLGINKYDGMPNNPVKFKNWNEYKEWKFKIYGKEMPEEYLDLNRFETIPALDEALAETDEPEVFHTMEEYKAAVQRWLEEDEDD